METAQSTLATPARYLDARISAAVAGDRAAQEALLLPYVKRVRNLVRYLLRGDSDVDDTAQRALCEVVRCLGSFRGDAPLGAWIDRITARVALQSARTRRAEARRHVDAFPESAAASMPNDERYLMRREAVRHLDDLPTDQRHVIVLHHVLGMSVPEICAELDVPFETVRSRLRIGMEKLRAALAQGERP